MKRWVVGLLVFILAVVVGAGLGFFAGDIAGFAFIAWRRAGSVRFEDGDLWTWTNYAGHYLPGGDRAGVCSGIVGGGCVGAWVSRRLQNAGRKDGLDEEGRGL